MATLEIGDYSRNGKYQITDTNWDSNGTLRVTVRELYGLSMVGPGMILEMRRLARRAISHPEKTTSSRVVREFSANGCAHVTFAVSRLPR
jgi:hypothetical protein